MRLREALVVRAAGHGVARHPPAGAAGLGRPRPVAGASTDAIRALSAKWATISPLKRPISSCTTSSTTQWSCCVYATGPRPIRGVAGSGPSVLEADRLALRRAADARAARVDDRGRPRGRSSASFAGALGEVAGQRRPRARWPRHRLPVRRWSSPSRRRRACRPRARARRRSRGRSLRDAPGGIPLARALHHPRRQLRRDRAGLAEHGRERARRRCPAPSRRAARSPWPCAWPRLAIADRPLDLARLAALALRLAVTREGEGAAHGSTAIAIAAHPARP